ncbi:tubulin-specific chaperone C [Synchiropus splendidus]|uniref:tubulin-specific chaperone C n=1 Tax=Synchiropus splendidus TaxID=270530 RepID=UPI00237D7EA6|nr:tubulin-specific chaperone C [Synchiropus splendidus]
MAVGGSIAESPYYIGRRRRRRPTSVKTNPGRNDMAAMADETPGPEFAAQMQERLLKREQARREEAERRKEAKGRQVVAEETSDYFLTTFNSERAAIEELLTADTEADRAAVAGRLEEVTAKVTQLQKFLNDSISFLNPHQLKRSQATLIDLRNRLNEAKEKAHPKKKFAFRARTKVAEKAETLDSLDGSVTVTSQFTQVDSAASSYCGFTNISDETLIKTRDEIQHQKVQLTHLTNCKVRLLGSPSSLHMKHIDNCEILCGPVSSSVFVDHCRNSTLAFACQQLRTHNTTDTQVYLHITTRAIIEDSKDVSFAPLSWSYPNMEQDFEAASLDPEKNNWNQVDDFNWLAAGTSSPNWSVIPEAERRTDWEY